MRALHLRRLSNAVVALPLFASVAACTVATPGPSEPVAFATAALSENTITRESFDNQGRQGDGTSMTPSISPNGRYVAFQTESNVWAPAIDTNGVTDVYLKDRQTGSVTLVSAAGGVVGNAPSLNVSVADDGSVAFVTDSNNLAPAASGRFAKVVVREPNGTIVRADVALSGEDQGEANGPSWNPQISGDGTSVVFQSLASNLIEGDTNGALDVFVSTGFASTPVIARASITESGGETNGASYYPTIDYDGSVIAFASDASNILYNDGNDATDVFAFVRSSGYVVPVSFATTGMGGAVGDGPSTLPQISGDGHTVVFRSSATNFAGPKADGLPNIYVNRVQSGRPPVAVSVSASGALGNGPSYQSAISFDGSVVAFVSVATNLGGDLPRESAGVFVVERSTGQTLRVDRAVGGTAPDGSALINSSLQFSGGPSVPSPSFLVFDSSADDLVYGDTNGYVDVFSASLSL